jgi:hypothetical protein
MGDKQENFSIKTQKSFKNEDESRMKRVCQIFLNVNDLTTYSYIFDFTFISQGRRGFVEQKLALSYSFRRDRIRNNHCYNSSPTLLCCLSLTWQHHLNCNRSCSYISYCIQLGLLNIQVRLK